MNMSFQRISRYRRMLTFLLSFFLAAGIGIGAMTLIEHNRFMRVREQAEAIAQIQASKISHVLDNKLALTDTLRVMIIEEQGVLNDFDRIVPEIMKNEPVRNIALAPEGIVDRVYPMEGNEAALGHNLLEDPERSKEALIAKETGKLMLAGPYELVQGGFGIVGRLPVYLENQEGITDFWGFVCVVIDIPEGIMEANLAGIEKSGYAYELWRISPDTEQKQIIDASPSFRNDMPAEDSFEIGNSKWTLSIVPKYGWVQKEYILFEIFLTALFALLVALLVQNVTELTISRNDLKITLYQQTVNYKLFNQLNEDLRVFRHDFNNHMLGLKGLLDKEDVGAAREYIQSMSDSLSDTVHIVNTENYIFDALLAQKLYEARKCGIYTQQEISIGKRLKIDNKDWSALFGNILDNATEACRQVKDMVPEIHVTVRYQGNVLKAFISNSMSGDLVYDQGRPVTNKADRNNHGMGLKQIETVIKKYHGVMETECADGIFTLSFILFYV